MTNENLERYVRDVLAVTLDTKLNYNVLITPVKGNGVNICVKVGNTRPDGTNEWAQVGYNLRVYGIESKCNIALKINNHYGRM